MRRKKSSLSITNIKEALYGIQSVDTILSNFFITRSKKTKHYIKRSQPYMHLSFLLKLFQTLAQ